MALTPEKEAVLHRLNAEAVRAHQVATDSARFKGRPIPLPPAPLQPEQIEYPKFLYHATEKPQVVADEAAHKALGAGWVEHPDAAKRPAVEAKKPEK